jgi:sulfur-carrier protein
MARVTLVLPLVLRDAVGVTTLSLEARTVAGALEEAYARVPALRHHLCDDDGSLKRHVLCFRNEDNTRDLGTLDVPVKDGDRIVIFQAISGG